MESTAVATFAVEKDVLGRTYRGLVIGPQFQVRLTGDHDARGELRLAQFFTEAGHFLVCAEVPPRVQGGGRHFVQRDAYQFVGRDVSLGDGFGPAACAAAASAVERTSLTQAVCDAHAATLRAMVRMASDCSPLGA